MDPNAAHVIEALIPAVALISVFGAPVVVYIASRFFKLREKELQLEGEARQWAEKSQAALEARVQRLEAVLLSLDHDLRGRAGLMEGPPREPAVTPGPTLEAPSKVR